ncbi:hypothetical protein HPB50_007672 [Hyalomma asiaticum]|uniref:Uncharacterized protein n=1 Tax=Hyalomma asiaticum TaxID=266040 RepID=A0ACB7SNZ2_HYAAI|nr:hypothetical protein HPB50_007672 [Hyalomma asiaticum]
MPRSKRNRQVGENHDTDEKPFGMFGTGTVVTEENSCQTAAKAPFCFVSDECDERQHCARRKCLHSQLDGIVQEAEGLLQEQDLSSPKVSISIDRINAIYAQMAKIDESLIDEASDELIEAGMIDASNYGDKIVTFTAKLRFAILDNYASQASRLTTSQASVGLR